MPRTDPDLQRWATPDFLMPQLGTLKRRDAQNASRNHSGRRSRRRVDFAMETGLEHAGYVPRGRKAEDERIDEKYNLVELSTN